MRRLQAFIRLATLVGATGLLAACAAPGVSAEPGSQPLVACLPAQAGSPHGAALGSLCEGYRDGTLDAATYRAALLDYPVLIAGLAALDGMGVTARGRGDIEATLAGTEALRQACRASGGVGPEPWPACGLVAPRWRRP